MTFFVFKGDVIFIMNVLFIKKYGYLPLKQEYGIQLQWTEV
jgi:hypothetical protein